MCSVERGKEAIWKVVASSQGTLDNYNSIFYNIVCQVFLSMKLINWNRGTLKRLRFDERQQTSIHENAPKNFFWEAQLLQNCLDFEAWKYEQSRLRSCFEVKKSMIMSYTKAKINMKVNYFCLCLTICCACSFEKQFVKVLLNLIVN